MDRNNVTCVQKVRFMFDFFEKREWNSGEQPPMKTLLSSTEVTSQAVRNLGNFMSLRISRIADMMDILKSSHNDWNIKVSKKGLIMETGNFDFHDAVSVLSSKGYKDDEYIIKVDYERKWGML